MSDFSERLRELIAVKFIGSQAGLMRAADLSAGSLSSYLSGESKPGFDAIIRICEVAEINPNWLLTGAGGMEGTQAAEITPGYNSNLDESETFLLLFYRRLPVKEKAGILDTARDTLELVEQHHTPDKLSPHRTRPDAADEARDKS